MGNDGISTNLSEVLSQFSESTKKLLNGINMEGLQKTQNLLSEYAKQIQVPGAQISIAIDAARPYIAMQTQVSELFQQSYIESKALSGYSTELIKQVADLQSSASLMASLSGATTMIKDLQMSLAASNVSGCVQAMQSTLDSNDILMADLAFFKTNDLLKSLSKEISLPSGFISDIKALNKSSAVRLADNDSILYRSDLHKFVSDNSESVATVAEMNIICGAEDVLDIASEEKFTENELMDFMSYLDSHPMMAMRNEIGQRIFEVISNFPKTSSFDKSEYYHCRARNREEPPFVWEQMKAAPYGVTFPGRYNHEGQAYFYFADTKEGAEKEIQKHMSTDDKEKKILQTVEIGTNRSVKLLDLSAKNLRGLNVFLRFVRFPLAEDNSKRPRAYLIPSFVSDCCSECGIDGIKYYGGKDYSNYVTWSDGFYVFKRNI